MSSSHGTQAKSHSRVDDLAGTAYRYAKPNQSFQLVGCRQQSWTSSQLPLCASLAIGRIA